MNAELINAQNKLHIVNVNIRESSFKLSEEAHSSFVLSELFNEDHKTQSYGDVSRIKVFLSEEDNRHCYIFEYSVGIRLLKVDSLSSEESESEDVTVGIEVVFDATYLSETKLTGDELKAFSENNVAFNVWPYWREYVQSACSRMGIPQINIPLYKIKK
ncbi:MULTISPECIES: hypothetical protein [Photorhabdus]|uniref:Preprotein translocase subunit SecB n=1 Tax=Photorhabdus tasmaniensis TaxID=1004159 RepID=A0ABX0GLA0_9GAMM|nr:hypothetical protein [Photorhabdus tasmaniensis]NHB89624.1 hypothetical protein [Photorhabdus tasmaniensis]